MKQLYMVMHVYSEHGYNRTDTPHSLWSSEHKAWEVADKYNNSRDDDSSYYDEWAYVEPFVLDPEGNND